MIIIALIIFFLNGNPILIWSKRVGLNNQIYFMPKFRTMKINTPQVATHLLKNPDQYLIFTGSFLRKYSLDELPQIFCLLNGTMNLIGPRPALYNQYNLINLRTKKNIHKLKPGITGYAQINGRDEISIIKKINYDYYYLKNKSLILDVKIIFFTIIKVLLKKNINH